jgi:hypothetical protein
VALNSNQLLDRLPAKDRAGVLAGCERVELVFPQVLEKPGDAIRHVYFPTDSFISLVTPMGGTHHLEVALAGDEGIHGVPLALGIDISPVHALVQGSGFAWRMEAAAFRRELTRLPKLRSCIDRYIYVLLAQVIQTAGCNRFHVVEQRVARWLLMTADRTHASTFKMTHEFLAYMLGVRRVGITEAASALHDRNLIAYRRGVVTILNRRGLERAACSCYRSDITTYKRVFS